MLKKLIFFITLLPLSCFAQFTISARVLNQGSTKPVANASVFLSNSSIGTKTANDGTFTLYNAKPGKYELVISIIGFEKYNQTITVDNNNITLPDILIFPKTILLSEVQIKPVVDPNTGRNYDWFKEELLGTSELAGECKVLNPDVLKLDYDEKTNILTASSQDFLEIENDALGYKIKYLLTDFKLDNGPFAKFRLDYQGSVLFEEMNGTPSQEKRWQRRRQEVYEGSLVHFLRSALADRIDQEGFRALLLRRDANPERPKDSIIEAKIKFYKTLRRKGYERDDSLSFWVKKNKLPKIIEKLVTVPLKKDAILKPTNQQGVFAFGPGSDKDALYITYNKHHHFRTDLLSSYLNNLDNKEATLIRFDTSYIFFDRNGAVFNPNSLIFSGVWGRARVAELLPVDYQAPENPDVQEDSTVVNNIFSKLNSFNATHIPEKAYLQLDKPYYAAGDTIYFKAYVTMGEQHEFSNLSGVLHVDLINTHNKIDQSIKLQIDSGLTWGDFALPDSLPKGNYRVRAYTQWMLNDSDPAFFEKNIEVGSINNKQIPENFVRKPLQTLSNKADIQFFPEGGSLATNIRSKVAFKAIGANGLGINVQGEILDNKDNEITGVSSIHLGMGYFYLKPEEGKTYKAKLTYANGEQSVVDLPIPDAKGIVLSVNNDQIPEATVTLQVNKAYYRKNKDKDFVLVIYSGGAATTIVRTLDSPTVRLDILKRHLHTGITIVTLFSPAGEPLCERLLFIQNYAQLNLGISSDKTLYVKREKVNIKLTAINRAGDPAHGHFSVSVTDENKVPEDEDNENTILNNLLLTSDLKGYVEQPNYYFNDTSSIAAKNLDILMLTQGYRRFTWKQVLDSSNTPIAYQSEKGLEINGMVKNLADKPVTGGMVNLIPAKSGAVLSSVTDDKGIFHFSNLIFNDTTHFVLSAVNAKGKNSTKITYFAKKPEPVITANQNQNMTVPETNMASYLQNAKDNQNELINYGQGKGIMLKEVKIKNKKLDDQYNTQNLAGAGNADQVMHSEEIERVQGSLATSLNGRLHGVSFVRQPGGQIVPVLTLKIMDAMPYNPPQPMLVIVDGTIINGDPNGPLPDIDFLNVNEVETIEVLKNAGTSIYGMSGANGVLIITTKHGGRGDIRDIASIGILPISPMGFYKAREFYSPKYDNTGQHHRQLDLRSTIYWQPEIKTDNEGSAGFEYYNADGTGTYKITIEGIDMNGNIGRQVYRYEVK